MIYDLIVLYDLFRIVVNGLKLCILYCFRICVVNVLKGKKYLFSLKSKIFEIILLKL